MNDTVVNEKNETAQLITTTNPNSFRNSTGIGQRHASRVVAAVIASIGGALPDGLTAQQQLTAAINILGMSLAEVIASSAQGQAARAELAAMVNAFVLKTSEELAKEYEQQMKLMQFVQETVSETGASVAPEGSQPN